MINNQDQKDLTIYSIKCTQILGNLFESLESYSKSEEENEKKKYINKISENITNFELTLDKCYIDVNESIFNITKSKNEGRNSNTNNNYTRADENDQRISHAEVGPMINEEQINDKEIIDFVVKKISDIKLQV